MRHETSARIAFGQHPAGNFKVEPRRIAEMPAPARQPSTTESRAGRVNAVGSNESRSHLVLSDGTLKRHVAGERVAFSLPTPGAGGVSVHVLFATGVMPGNTGTSR